MSRPKGVVTLRWTNEETKQLTKSCQLPMQKLKTKFPNRSEQAIKTKICYLGLKRCEDPRAVRTEKLFMF